MTWALGLPRHIGCQWPCWQHPQCLTRAPGSPMGFGSDPPLDPLPKCSIYVLWSKVAILGMVIHPTFNRNPYNGYINPYYWVDDHPLLWGNNGSLDPSTYGCQPKNRGILPPKWMVKIMKNPIKMDDLGGPPLFLETPIWHIYLQNCVVYVVFM